MFGIFKRGENKKKGRGDRAIFFKELRESVIVLPTSKGKFRVLFPNMVPKPKNPDAQIRRDEGGES